MSVYDECSSGARHLSASLTTQTHDQRTCMSQSEGRATKQREIHRCFSVIKSCVCVYAQLCMCVCVCARALYACIGYVHYSERFTLYSGRFVYRERYQTALSPLCRPITIEIKYIDVQSIQTEGWRAKLVSCVCICIFSRVIVSSCAGVPPIAHAQTHSQGSACVLPSRAYYTQAYQC
jgi:hypothetical protein